MAALTLTTSQVHWVSGPTEQGVSGEALTRGQVVYASTDSKYYKAKGNGTALQARARGLALADVGVGDPILIARPGAVVELGAGAAPTLAVAYYIQATAGSLYPIADVASTNFVTIVGVITSGTKITVICFVSEAQLA